MITALLPRLALAPTLQPFFSLAAISVPLIWAMDQGGFSPLGFAVQVVFPWLGARPGNFEPENKEEQTGMMISMTTFGRTLPPPKRPANSEDTCTEAVSSQTSDFGAFGSQPQALARLELRLLIWEQPIQGSIDHVERARC